MVLALILSSIEMDFAVRILLMTLVINVEVSISTFVVVFANSVSTSSAIALK